MRNGKTALDQTAHCGNPYHGTVTCHLTSWR
jgi:hypothetical protein